MARLNYFAALSRTTASSANPGNIVKTSSATDTGSGAGYDVEVRMQINNGTGTPPSGITGLTKNDVVNALKAIIGDIESNGIASGAGTGADLPVG